MPEIQTRAGRVAYTDIGEGPPIMLLHAALHDSHDYDAILTRLAEAHRVLAVDWPGHGASATEASVTAALLADVLEDVVSGLRLGPTVFVGNSVGGFAAARLALTHPDRVAGLVLVNSGGFTPVNAVTRMLCRLLGTPAIARVMMRPFIRGYMKSQSEFDREVQRRALARSRTSAGRAIWVGLWRSFAGPEHDLRASASRILTPTLIIWGARDIALPLRAGKATQRALAGSQLVTLPTGHVVFASDPDGFIEHLEPFLAAVHSSSSPQQ